MTRISTFCAVSGALAVLALSANGASAGNLVPATPKVTVNPVQPKVPNAHGGWDQRSNVKGGTGGIVSGGGGAGKVTGTTSGTKQ